MLWGQPRYCTTSRAATPMVPTVTQTSLESGESDCPPGYLATTCRSEADVNSGCALMSAAVASERLRLPRPWWRGYGLSCCSRIWVAPGDSPPLALDIEATSLRTVAQEMGDRSSIVLRTPVDRGGPIPNLAGSP